MIRRYSGYKLLWHGFEPWSYSTALNRLKPSGKILKILLGHLWFGAQLWHYSAVIPVKRKPCGLLLIAISQVNPLNSCHRSFPLQSLHQLRRLKSHGQLTVRQLKRMAALVKVINEGFGVAFREGAFSQPNQPKHTRIVRFFCRRLCEALNIEVTVHAPMPVEHALWVSNHVSWLDVAVIGSQTRIFFLAKAEIQHWPVFGRLAQAGGTLFIQRGSGDSVLVKEQISGFLNQKIPVLFFPEATTTDGRTVKRLHGKLLASAIATGTPIQPLVLCYVNQHGQLDQVVPFVDDAGFAAHLLQVLKLEKITAHVLPLAAISPIGHDIASLTAELHRQMSEGLLALQQQVLLQP